MSDDPEIASDLELEAHTHRHVHVENDVVFPAVPSIERDLATGPRAVADEGGEAPCWAHLVDGS